MNNHAVGKAGLELVLSDSDSGAAVLLVSASPAFCPHSLALESSFFPMTATGPLPVAQGSILHPVVRFPLWPEMQKFEGRNLMLQLRSDACLLPAEPGGVRGCWFV